MGVAVEDRCRKIVGRIATWGYTGAPRLISGSTHLVDDLDCDDLDRLELVMHLEEEFGIEIGDDTFERVETFGDLVRLVAVALFAPTPPLTAEEKK